MTENTRSGFFPGLWVRLLSILWLLLLVPAGIFVAMPSLFLFDAPGSERSLLVAALFWSLVSFPVSLTAGGLLGLILSWSTSPRRFALAKAAVCVPFGNIILGAAAVGLLQLLCQGSFSCWL